MKLPLCLLTPLATGFLLSSAYALKPGDAVTPDALGKATVIQGDIPKTWEPGKLYVLECWATWCGPCIKAIPHVDELYDKYKDKGLRIVGVNVWEDDQSAVSAFVKSKGDGMSYPVTYVGQGGEFEKSWLTAAGVEGIPHAFVVKDGKYLFSTHPAELEAELIEKLLAGGKDSDDAIASLQAKDAEKEQLQSIFARYGAAKEKKDTAAQSAIIAEAEKLEAAKNFVPVLKMDMVVSAEKWDEVPAILDSFPADSQPDILAQVAADLVMQENPMLAKAPDSLKKAVAERLNKVVTANQEPDPISRLYLSQLQWGVGDKAGAVTTAKAAAANPGELPAAPLTRYAKSLEEGKGVTLSEVIGWLQEAPAEDKAPAAEK